MSTRCPWSCLALGVFCPTPPGLRGPGACLSIGCRDCSLGTGFREDCLVLSHSWLLCDPPEREAKVRKAPLFSTWQRCENAAAGGQHVQVMPSGLLSWAVVLSRKRAPPRGCRQRPGTILVVTTGRGAPGICLGGDQGCDSPSHGAQDGPPTENGAAPHVTSAAVKEPVPGGVKVQAPECLFMKEALVVVGSAEGKTWL